jgi:hypothetical protein
MRFLVPAGGVVDPRFGVLTSPGHRGIPAGLPAGLAWGGDNQAYSGRFRAELFLAWLDIVSKYRETCLFVACPDLYGDAAGTMRLYFEWADRIRARGLPAALVAQDGQELAELPAGLDALFVGGSTAWKVSQAAGGVIRRAQQQGAHVHIGRVNWWKRYQHFAEMPGSERWTCDGTRTRFDGRERTLSAWAKYQTRPVGARLPGCDSDS